MRVHFIADLHLCAEHPDGHKAFLDYLAGPARTAQRLYILGDLFEYWIGDDDTSALAQSVALALSDLAAAGTRLHFMPGNRDFLLGADYARAAGRMQLLDDPSIIELDGVRVALTHGDLLCTDDHAYQAFRRQVRNRQWQQSFLAQPLPKRREIVQDMRRQSHQATQDKSRRIMDVNPATVDAFLRRLDYPDVLIQGHTHRPRRHEHRLDGRTLVRWVLSDWRDRSAPYLSWDNGKLNAVDFPRD